jgi:hypothetical protein
MINLSVKRFSDIVVEKLKSLNYEIVLTNPSTENSFPLLEIHTPLKSISKMSNNIPIGATFQISITCWNDKQRSAMDMTDEVEEILQELNFTRTNTNSSNYDQIIKKYGIMITFEVRYNGMTNSFELK